MFIVFLRFSEAKARAAEFMSAHKAWIRRGLADGVFLLVGSLQPQAGGAILAHGLSRAELDGRLSEDPFVQEDVVRAEVFEIAPNLADPRLQFLAAGA
jgi:uncharacterized protein YciI